MDQLRQNKLKMEKVEKNIRSTKNTNTKIISIRRRKNTNTRTEIGTERREKKILKVHLDLY